MRIACVHGDADKRSIRDDSLPEAFPMPSLGPDVSACAIDWLPALLADVRITRRRRGTVCPLSVIPAILQPARFGVVDILELGIRLGFRQTRIPFARSSSFGQLLVIADDARRAISKRQHQRLGAIRRLDAALAGLIFGFNLDLAARVDLIANRRELSDGDLVVESRDLAILEAFAQTPVELRLEVAVAVREVGRFADIDAVDIDETEILEVSREVCAYSGAIEVDFGQPVLERP